MPPRLISASESFWSEDTGTLDGAVKYHICFPSRFDFLNNEDACVEDDIDEGLYDGCKALSICCGCDCVAVPLDFLPER